MRSVLLSLLFLFSITLLPAQNDKPKKGSKHPSFVKIKDKPNKNKAKQLFKEMFGMKAKDALNLDDSFTDPPTLAISMLVLAPYRLLKTCLEQVPTKKSQQLTPGTP